MAKKSDVSGRGETPSWYLEQNQSWSVTNNSDSKSRSANQLNLQVNAKKKGNIIRSVDERAVPSLTVELDAAIGWIPGDFETVSSIFSTFHFYSSKMRTGFLLVFMALGSVRYQCTHWILQDNGIVDTSDMCPAEKKHVQMKWREFFDVQQLIQRWVISVFYHNNGIILNSIVALAELNFIRHVTYQNTGY